MARLSEAAIHDELTGLPRWTYQDGSLCRVYTFQAFMSGIEFVNQVARLAEEAGHHPDITINYTRVTLGLCTHDAGGVTEKDVALACQIEALGAA